MYREEQQFAAVACPSKAVPTFPGSTTGPSNASPGSAPSLPFGRIPAGPLASVPTGNQTFNPQPGLGRERKAGLGAQQREADFKPAGTLPPHNPNPSPARAAVHRNRTTSSGLRDANGHCVSEYGGVSAALRPLCEGQPFHLSALDFLHPAAVTQNVAPDRNFGAVTIRNFDLTL
jgi:hypothetical protein